MLKSTTGLELLELLNLADMFTEHNRVYRRKYPIRYKIPVQIYPVQKAQKTALYKPAESRCNIKIEIKDRKRALSE